MTINAFGGLLLFISKKEKIVRNLLRVYRIMFVYWRYLILSIFFIFGFSILSTTSLAFIKPILDFVFVPKSEVSVLSYGQFFSQMFAVFSQLFSISFGELLLNFKDSLLPLSADFGNLMQKTNSLLLLNIIAFGAFVMIILKNIFFYGSKIFTEKLRNSTIRDIRDIIFDRYMRQSLSFFQKNKIGDSMVRMVDDVNLVSNLYINSVFAILQNALLVITLGTLALILNAKLLLISIVVLPLFPLLLRLLGKKIKKYAQKIQQQFSSLFTHVNEVLTSMHIVKAFCKEEYENNRFKKINKIYLKYAVRSVVYSAINTPLAEINSILMIIIILILGGRSVLAANTSFTFGDFMVFLGAVASMLQPIKIITKSYVDLKKAGVSLSRVSYLMDLKSEVVQIDNPLSFKSFEDCIKLVDVNFAYNEKPVLEGINLTINKGENVAIVGESGSGKTTLVALLQRMFDVKGGQILLDGVDIKNLKISDVRSTFGTVTQEPILFSGSVAFNIAYGSPKKVTPQQIATAATIANADEFIANLPNGYEEFLHSKGSNLSGGQRQRISIARAVIGDPPVLIFDEATSALDTIAEKKVQKAISHATKNRTVVAIAHRLSTVLNSDKIVVLSNGKIVGIGKNSELLETCNEYKKLHKLQFEKQDEKEI